MVGADAVFEEIVLQNMNSKTLIINADDFGLSAGTNAAIIACYQAGSVSSTTLMVNMPATVEAAKLAKENPGLGVGLHFNITSGCPVSNYRDITSLVDTRGGFHKRSNAEKKAVLGRFKSSEVAAELDAQWHRFLSLGLIPTHLDSHQHIHAFPAVFDIVADFCAKQAIPLRIPWVWKPTGKVSLKRRTRMRVLGWMIQRNMKHWGNKIRTNSSLTSIFDSKVDKHDYSLADYRKVLELNHITPLELMVHPSDVDSDHKEMTQISHVSKRDFEILSNSNLGDVARNLGYEIVDYSILMK